MIDQKQADRIKRNQDWQDKFLRKECDKLLAWSASHGGNEYMPEINLTCRTCQKSENLDKVSDSTWSLHTFEGALQWLHHHEGHDTWIERLPNVRFNNRGERL